MFEHKYWTNLALWRHQGRPLGAIIGDVRVHPVKVKMTSKRVLMAASLVVATAVVGIVAWRVRESGESKKRTTAQERGRVRKLADQRRMERARLRAAQRRLARRLRAGIRGDGSAMRGHSPGRSAVHDHGVGGVHSHGPGGGHTHGNATNDPHRHGPGADHDHGQQGPGKIGREAYLKQTRQAVKKRIDNRLGHLDARTKSTVVDIATALLKADLDLEAKKKSGALTGNDKKEHRSLVDRQTARLKRLLSSADYQRLTGPAGPQPAMAPEGH